MEEQGRPDPDALLKAIGEEENREKSGRGRLKIFFGFAAGVGKTYAMLDTAREDRKAGIDVVVGYVEPHSRPDTQALLEGMEIIPPGEFGYKGITLKEFDLDAALRRRPQILLVDELAHTNAKGCRHAKRYQDVTELLDAGIDVYTTVNVQHLESLHDIVASITHIRVNERIPDEIFDKADKVELVDIEPEELLKRLASGKIYKQDQASRAMVHFFTKENLTALREIALRRTADQVNHSAAEERAATGKDYYTEEHVLVCLSSAPSNARVIRTAARMAGAFHAKLTGIVVETSRVKAGSEPSRKSLESNINLVKQFRGSVIVAYGDDIVRQISEYARRSGVSKIVIGRTVRDRRRIYLRPTLIDRLIKQVPNLDVYVIPDVHAVARARRRKDLPPQQRIPVWDLLKSGGILTAATLLGYVLDIAAMGQINVVMVYMIGVLMAAYFTSRPIYGVAASAASVLLFNFFFTEPRYTLRADASIYPFTFLAMLASALLISSLAGRLKKQAALSAEESRHMQALFNISRSLKMAETEADVLDICARQVERLLNRSLILYNTVHGPGDRYRVYLKENARDGDGAVLCRPEEEAVAAWVYKNLHKAGRATDTLPGAAACYIPVMKGKKVYAVLGIRLEKDERISANDKNVLNIILEETVLALVDRQTD